MPRAGWTKPPSDRRLSDLVSVGVLTRTFPAEVVDEVIAECGRTEQRHRSLPARVMAYFSIGMALHAEGSYEDVLGLLCDGLGWVSGTDPIELPSKSAIFQARQRLGSEPLAALFERVAVPLAGPGTPGSWLAGRRLVAVDGTCVDVADTDANAEWFGRAGVNKGERAAFPQARVVAVAECGTHAIFDAEVGAYTTSENTLAADLVDRLEPGMVLLADRGFCGFPLWQRAAATGADLLWRAKANMKPRHVRALDDGSWLAEFRPGGNASRHTAPLVIRVIEYTIDDGRANNDETYRLFTTIIDPDEASAEDLAGAYAQRWEIETAFDELKTHLRGARVVLRSKTPELVRQEAYGFLLAHYAVRDLMHQAALAATPRARDPDTLSFVHAVRVIRRTLPRVAALPPSGPGAGPDGDPA